MSMERTVISLFTGAGGLDMGLKAAGFTTNVAVDMDQVACNTLRLNSPKLPVLQTCIQEVSSKEILRAAGLRKRQAHLLVGGPPCQPFSKSGYWANGDSRRLLDPRANTLRDFMRVLRESLPHAFVLENVPGFLYKGKDEAFWLIHRQLARINRAEGVSYSLSWKVLNAADYGVPQSRVRTFIVGLRDGTEFRFPEPRFGACGLGERMALQPYRTSWDAIGDLPEHGPSDEDLELTGKWADLIPSIPEGGNYLYHTHRQGGLPLFGWRTRYWSFLLKLSKKLPSWTLQATPGSAIGPFHWSNRLLSTREMLRIQTFPDRYKLCGDRRDAQRQIGNAVPCLLGEVIGNSLREALYGESVRRRKLKLMTPYRGVPPRAFYKRRVPTKYLFLVGKHATHPGHGKGPGRIAMLARQA